VPLHLTMSKHRLTTTIGSTVLGVVVGGFLLMQFASNHSDYAPRTMTNQDPAFAVTMFSFTDGTNHTVYRGSPVMGRINTMLVGAGIKPFTSARQCAVTTTRETSVLWVSFKHSNALVGTGAPYIAALLTRPDGVTEMIEPKASMSDPVSFGYLTAWSLPSHATNYPGWWFHLVTRPDGKGSQVLSYDGAA